MPYEDTMRPRRKKLREIELTVRSFGRASPRFGWSVVIGFCVVVIGFMVDIHSLVGFAAAISIGLFSYLFGPFKKTWGDLLDDQLCAYAPIDAQAFSDLHKATKAAGVFDLDALEKWLERERAAFGALQAPVAGKAPRFIRKEV